MKKAIKGGKVYGGKVAAVTARKTVTGSQKGKAKGLMPAGKKGAGC